MVGNLLLAPLKFVNTDEFKRGLVPSNPENERTTVLYARALLTIRIR
jgi:hypothetical protein